MYVKQEDMKAASQAAVNALKSKGVKVSSRMADAIYEGVSDAVVFNLC